MLASLAAVWLRLLLLWSAGDELLASCATAVVCRVCLLAVGTLEGFNRYFGTFSSKGAGGSLVIAGALDAGRFQMTMGASVAPFLAAPTLGWSVTLCIVICPADNDIVDRLDVAQLGCGHGALLEVQDEVIVFEELRIANAHGFDVFGDDTLFGQFLAYLLNRRVGETKQNNTGRLLCVDLVSEVWNLAFHAAFQKRLVHGDGCDFHNGATTNLLKQETVLLQFGQLHFVPNT